MSHTLLPVTPLPLRSVHREGCFTVDRSTIIVAPPALQDTALYLQKVLREESALSLEIDRQNHGNAIRIQPDPAPGETGAEGYRLSVDRSGVLISAETGAGAFYGVQTLRQLIPASERGSKNGAVTIPFLEIEDSPRFPWRGFMLDTARHFFGVDTIMQLIDAQALLKMNRLHLHLCDDQGWRLEIEKYPRLREIGSHRPDTQAGGLLSRKRTGLPHSGFFTKEEMSRIIAYAAERYITLVPEIEMPGHCRAALAAYPELGCTGGPYRVSTTAGIKKDIYCAGKEAVFSFLQDVIDEVIALFPSPWIHLGGDEAPRTRWKNCPHCRERIRAEGLRNEAELQAYFINRMVKYIEDKGRRAIGWNEILSESLPPSAIGQHWLRGKKESRRHLRRGGKIIGSYFFYSYLDYNHGVLPLSKVYSYDPVPRGLEPRYRKNVLGIETPMWTETAPTRQHMHAFVFPRLLAAAENAWTPPGKNRSFEDFLTRLPHLLRRLRRLGISHTTLKAAQPGPLKRMIMWTKIGRQSSVLPDAVERGSSPVKFQ